MSQVALGLSKMDKASFEVFCMRLSADVEKNIRSLLTAAYPQSQLCDDSYFVPK